MTPLERYGFPEGDEPRPVRCDSGYWTPWHVATEELKRLRAERERDDVAFELLVKEASLLRAERDALRVAAQMVVQAHEDGEDMQSGIDMLTRLLDAALAAKDGT